MFLVVKIKVGAQLKETKTIKFSKQDFNILLHVPKIA
jgi:hypothetical protein